MLPAAHYAALTTRDFDVLAGAFRRWDNRFRQLGRGPFHGEVRLLQVGGVQVFRARLNRAIHAEGLPPAGWFCCAPVVATNVAATWRGRRLKVSQARVIVPGQEVDHVTAADYDTVSLLVEGDLLRASAAGRYGFDPEEWLAGREAVSADPAAVAALCRDLDALLRRAAERPALLALPGAVRRIEQACVGRFLELLAGADADPATAAVSNAARLVGRAEEFLAAHLAAPLTVLDLCRELDVSERTLHYAFREARGLSPMAYVKSKRLNAVRHELKAGGATVREVAQRWGFWHTGEFAADYRRLFGELPSETLAG